MKAQKIEDCRKIYRDIVAGYTAIKNPRCFIKHLKESDLGALENKNDVILKEIEANGILYEKDVLLALDKREIWTKKNEEDYWQLISSIQDLEQERKRIVSRQQAEELLVVINKRKEEVEKIAAERDSHLRISAEYFIKKKNQQDLIRISLFKDEELKRPLFSKEEFDDLDPKELGGCFEAFNSVSEIMSSSNIRKVSITPMFLNAFTLADDNAYQFYGKFITELSFYQIELFNNGKLNKFILEHCDTVIEDYSDLDKALLWYDAEHSIILGKIEKNKREAKN